MFNFENLNTDVRHLMLKAIEDAEATKNIYFSSRFNQTGKDNWLNLLKQAALHHNEHWLAFQLEYIGSFNSTEMFQKPSGSYSVKHVPHNASQTLAEGQFNRFYMLGLCLHAKTRDINSLEIYRAKTRSDSRPTSQGLEGTKISVSEVEAQLKVVLSSHRSPLLQPNSGLSVKLT
jgi:hypothetical protein